MSDRTDTQTKAVAANVNTLLLAVVLGILSWVGYTTQNTSVAVAVIGTTTATHDRELLELRTRIAAVELQLASIRRP